MRTALLAVLLCGCAGKADRAIRAAEYVSSVAGPAMSYVCDAVAKRCTKSPCAELESCHRSEIAAHVAALQLQRAVVSARAAQASGLGAGEIIEQISAAARDVCTLLRQYWPDCAAACAALGM